MNKKILVAILAVAVASGAYYFFGSSEKNSDYLTLNGNVDIRQVSLAFNASGRVQQVLVEEGDQVKAGQVLAKLDTEALRLQVAEAEANIQMQQDNLARLENGARPQEIAQAKTRVSAAQAQVTKAKNELARLQSLSRETGGLGTSKQEIDAAASSLKVAQAQAEEQKQALALVQEGARKEELNASKSQLKAYQAKLGLLQYQLSQGELKSPVDAVVRSRLVEAGDMVTPQKNAFTLALTEPKWVRAYVNEPELGKIQTGMTALVTTDSDPNQPILGKISYISSVAEFTPKSVQTTELRSSLVYEIRILVKDPDNRLRLGQPATVQLSLEKPETTANAEKNE